MVEKRDFSDRFLKAVKPAPPGKRVILYDSALPGFGLRVTDKCSEEDRGAFVLVARFPGSPNPTARRIGDYPAMTLAKARDTAREWKDDIRRGVDPKVKKAEQEREEKRRNADTFAAVFDAFAADHLSSLRTGKEVHASIRKHVYPSWAERPLSSIKRAEVNELIRDIRKGAPIAANRVLAYLKKFFGWAVDQDLLEVSPAASIKRPSKETKRDRVLTEAEIRSIWTACGKLGSCGDAFKLMLLTGQRRAEVGGMAWAEIDPAKKNWTLARERTKADRAHEVPLSDTAMSIIEQRPRLGAFVLSTSRAQTPLSGWAKAKRRLDEIIAESSPGFVAWHLHDLRRTCATYMGEARVDRIVISKILNHAEGGVTGVYDRFRYDLEKRRALEAWGRRLQEIVEFPPNGTVLHISKGEQAS